MLILFGHKEQLSFQKCFEKMALFVYLLSFILNDVQDDYINTEVNKGQLPSVILLSQDTPFLLSNTLQDTFALINKYLILLKCIPCKIFYIFHFQSMLLIRNEDQIR